MTGSSSEKWPNRETVENIGQRIRQLVSESRGMTQSQQLPGTLACIPVVPVADRKRTDDAEPRNSGKDFRSARRRSEPFLRSGNEWRSSPGRSIHPGVAAVPPAARLGTVAIDSEAPGRDQRPRLQRQRRCAPLGTASSRASRNNWRDGCTQLRWVTASRLNDRP